MSWVTTRLGMGTWHMAEETRRRASEIASLRLGLDLGLSVIDTAEMYADGASEELVGEAIAGRRDEVFLVSKVVPSHATRRGTVAACEASLRRLGTDRLDLYLLHWPGSIPLEQTLEGFADLLQQGKIRRWGVSNFGVEDLEELLALQPESAVRGDRLESNQVLYNLARRGIEYDLLPWCQSTLDLPIMAYSPIEQGRVLRHPEVRRIAAEHAGCPAQVALAWVLRQAGVIAIPKAGTPDHVREDRAALDLRLTDADLAALERAFPPPTRAVPLEML